MKDQSENKYRLSYDLHTHTTFSHGKGSIEDNVKAAVARGLKTIGISDHGPGHVTYGVKRKNIAVMRDEIDRLKPFYPQIEILLGVEANVINPSGRLDVLPEELEHLDYLLAGYHFGVFGEKPVQALGLHTRNFILTGWFHRSTKKQLKHNTDLVVRAIYENEIKILTHPGDKGVFDIAEIAAACAARGTLMEISTWHDWLTVEGIKQAAKSDTRFAISSDAHTPDRIGDCLGAVERSIAAGLDLERIENLIVRDI
ncbi:PHP domain-containing protein [Anoxybacterium hadale]|uniref:PHP domain-containing protein n=1 Tax=Anoxybacterium hadale TaxID=3408580 RepID=UPI003AFF8C6F